MHSGEKMPPVSEHASCISLCAASLPSNQTEIHAPTSIEVPFVHLGDTSDDDKRFVWPKSDEALLTEDDEVHLDLSNSKCEESFLLEDNDDMVKLVTPTEDLASLLFEDESAEDDIVVRVDTPVTKPAAGISPTSFPGPSKAARLAVRYTESNPDDQENQPPPKWSPARIARDLQLSNPLYTHANPVFAQHGKPASSVGTRVPLADVTKIVQNEMERKKMAMKGKKPAPKSELSSTSYDMRKKSNRVSVRMLR